MDKACADILFDIDKKRTVGAIRFSDAQARVTRALGEAGIPCTVTQSGNYFCFIGFSTPNGQKVKMRTSFTKLDKEGMLERLVGTARSIMDLCSGEFGRVVIR